jgi:hypothetical protein
MQPPLNVEKLINFAEVGEFTLPEQLTQAYEVYQRVRAMGDNLEPFELRHEKILAAELVAAAHRGEDVSLIELGREFIASRDEGQAFDWSRIIMREALELATEQAESIVDELADEIILEHLQPAHKRVLAAALEVVDAIGVEPITELLNSPRLAIYDGRHERNVRSALRALAPLADRFAAILAARDRINIAGGVNWSTPRRVEHDLDHAFAYVSKPEALAPGGQSMGPCPCYRQRFPPIRWKNWSGSAPQASRLNHGCRPLPSKMVRG